MSRSKMLPRACASALFHQRIRLQPFHSLTNREQRVCPISVPPQPNRAGPPVQLLEHNVTRRFKNVYHLPGRKENFREFFENQVRRPSRKLATSLPIWRADHSAGTDRLWFSIAFSISESANARSPCPHGSQEPMLQKNAADIRHGAGWLVKSFTNSTW